MEKPKHPLKLLRAKHKLTQPELAMLLDYERPNMIAQVEGGFHLVPPEMAFSVCDRFKLDPVEFEQQLFDYRRDYGRYLVERLNV